MVFAYGQEQMQIKGRVSATDGELLIGVMVMVEGTSNGTVTDLDGNYELNAKPGDKLVFSYVGYKKETVTIRNQRVIDVIMATDQANLEEVVVVGYGSAKKVTLTGAVSAISAGEIRRVPTSSVQNTLQGKLPGFFSQQRSGQPGRDASDFFIRGVNSLNDAGNQPLIIVDDVQYSYDQLQQINVNEIESISILKDASTTAIYGIKGANGVLIVKTRRGSQGAPQINVRLEGGVQMPVRKPKFLNSYQTASLVNEAYMNDNRADELPFSNADLTLFQTGEDPYGHPDVNWYNEIFKSMAYQQNANVDISGGTERLRYFVTGGFFSQNGLVKDFKDPYGDVNTNYYYKRFNYRTNLDFDVTSTTKLRLDMTSRFMNINEPYSLSAIGAIYDFDQMRPYSAPVLNPDGSYAYNYIPGSTTQNPTLNARLASEGYKRTRRYDTNILFEVSQGLDFITKGLSGSVRVAYANIDENTRKIFRGPTDYPSYHYDSASDSYLLRSGSQYAFQPYVVLGDQEKAIKDLNIQGFLNYSKTINNDHTIKGMFIYNMQKHMIDKEAFLLTAVEAAVPENFRGYTTTLNYNYKDKYMVDLNMAYNGTDRFNKNNRYGFFPAIGLGYNIAEESFFQEKFPAIPMLKLRASYGLVGSDVAAGNRYLYKQVYERDENRYYFGELPTGYYGVKEGKLGNENVTWEKARKFDVGIDGNLFGKLFFTVDYFFDYRYDQLVEREDISGLLGIGVSPTNAGKTQNQGFDGMIGYDDKFGDVFFHTNFVFSYAKNRIRYAAEAQQRYPWMAKTGRPINQPFGYTFEGFYTEEDIEKIKLGDPSVPIPNASMDVQPGDLKYKDLNGDGIIDEFDKGPIGKPNLPTTTLGWTVGATYKGISLSLLFQGSFDYSFSIIGTGIESFKGQFQPIHLKRWTQERVDNGEPIEFPRLTTDPSTVNSAELYMSDFWLVNAWYVRLKTIDLSYQLPSKILPKGISNIRLYSNAYNLFTWTSYSKYQQDPEIQTNTSGDSYLNQKVVNLGIQVTF